MKKRRRILVTLLIAVFAFSQLPMAALAAEGVGGDGGVGSEEVADWETFEAAIADPNVEVITLTNSFDADDETIIIQICRAIRITSESQQTVNLKGASIEVVDGGNLTLDGALVLQGSGDQVIKVEGGEATISGDVKIEADLYGVRINGGTVNIKDSTITTTGVGVYVKGGEVNISGGAEISGVDVGVDVDGGTINITGGTVEATGYNSTGVGVNGGTVNITGGTIETSAGYSIGVKVDGGEATIGGEAEISAADVGVNVNEGCHVNIIGKAKISTGSSSVFVDGGTLNIGEEAEISMCGNSGRGVNIRDSDNVTISGKAKITGNYSGGGHGFGVQVHGSTVTIGGEAEISVTNDDPFGGASGVGVIDEFTSTDSTVIIKDKVKINADEGVRVTSGTATITGGTITADSVGVFVYQFFYDEVGVEVIIDGEVEISATDYGVLAEGGTATICGGTITATGEEGFAVLASGGDVNLISSAELVINGDIYEGVWVEDGEGFKRILIELLESLPAPISVSAGQKTAEFTLEPGEGVTFVIDEDNTSEALEAEIDDEDKVTLTLPGSAGTYQLVLSISLEEGTFKLTVPVIVKPRSTSSPTPTIPAAGGAARVSYISLGGTLSLQMPFGKVNEIIEKSGGTAAELDLSHAANATAARLPGGALSSFAGTGLDLTLKLPAGTMTLSRASVASVAAEAADENVRIELRQAATNTLTEAQQAAVGSGDVVLDINIYAGTQKISNFDGSLAMAVPYDGPLPVAVWYLSDAGELERLDCTFSNGVVYFTLDHLSLYLLGQSPFADVEEGGWYYDAVAFIAQKEITKGTTATTFSPDATLTRGQFVTMLLRAYEITPDDETADNFDDAGDTYYTGYLAAAKALGIANGVGDNKFAPEQDITRQEMFTLLYNALGVLGGLPTGDSGRTLSDFADSDAIAPWATEALSALVEKGIVSGSGGRLEPDATTTRAQMAQVMYNLLGK